MIKANKAIALVLAVIVSILPVSYSYAAEYDGPNGDLGTLTEEQEEFGHSTFSFIQTEQNPMNVSFEIPLYVTMAVVSGNTSVFMPSNYSIKNTSAKYSEGSGISAYSIAVVGISFTKLEGAMYGTVETVGTDYREMIFSIGGVVMPAIDRYSGPVTMNANMKANDSVFYSDNQYNAIPATGDVELSIPLKATLSAIPSLDGNNTPVAQFKVCYTVSALNHDGDALGSVYAGDNKVEAGLE